MGETVMAHVLPNFASGWRARPLCEGRQKATLEEELHFQPGAGASQAPSSKNSASIRRVPKWGAAVTRRMASSIK